MNSAVRISKLFAVLSITRIKLAEMNRPCFAAADSPYGAFKMSFAVEAESPADFGDMRRRLVQPEHFKVLVLVSINTLNSSRSTSRDFQ